MGRSWWLGWTVLLIVGCSESSVSHVRRTCDEVCDIAEVAGTFLITFDPRDTRAVYVNGATLDELELEVPVGTILTYDRGAGFIRRVGGVTADSSGVRFETTVVSVADAVHAAGEATSYTGSVRILDSTLGDDSIVSEPVVLRERATNVAVIASESTALELVEADLDFEPELDMTIVVADTRVHLDLRVTGPLRARLNASLQATGSTAGTATHRLAERVFYARQTIGRVPIVERVRVQVSAVVDYATSGDSTLVAGGVVAGAVELGARYDGRWSLYGDGPQQREAIDPVTARGATASLDVRLVTKIDVDFFELGAVTLAPASFVSFSTDTGAFPGVWRRLVGMRGEAQEEFDEELPVLARGISDGWRDSIIFASTDSSGAFCEPGAVHCEDGRIFNCTASGDLASETSCASGACSSPTMCAPTPCQSNFCEDRALTAGTHCDGDWVVECGVQSGCSFELSRTTCEDPSSCVASICRLGSCEVEPVPDPCGSRECGPSPRGCGECGSCASNEVCAVGGACQVIECPNPCESLQNGACVLVADQTPCGSDGNVCTQDVCLAGVCAHPPLANDCQGRICGPSPSGCFQCGTCASGFCDGDGECQNCGPCQFWNGATCTATANGAPCADDGDACTNDVCAGGSCSHPSVPNDCGTRVCGASPSTCTPSCGSCGANETCTPTGQCAGPSCGECMVASGSMCIPTPNGTPCTSDGDPATNDVCVGGVCTHPAIACGPNDGMCPSGCTAINDPNCSPVCGNSVLEPGETCDGNCQLINCSAGTCQTNTQTGSAATCDVACTGPVAAANNTCCGANQSCQAGVCQSCSGSVTLRSSEDTTVLSTSPNLNFGIDNGIMSGVNSGGVSLALIRFPASSVVPSSGLQSATLCLDPIFSVTGGPSTITLAVWEANCNAQWQEGSATWLSTFNGSNPNCTTGSEWARVTFASSARQCFPLTLSAVTTTDLWTKGLVIGIPSGAPTGRLIQFWSREGNASLRPEVTLTYSTCSQCP